MKVIKRDGSKEEFNPQKIEDAILKAFNAEGYELSIPEKDMVKMFSCEFLEPDDWEEDHEVCMTVESIQDDVEKFLFGVPEWFDVAKSYMLYREKHKEARLIKDKLKYIHKYAESEESATNLSNTDDNANSNKKNESSYKNSYKQNNNSKKANFRSIKA